MADGVNWYDFSKKKLSEDVIRTLKEKLNFPNVFQYSELTETAIEEFAELEDDWPVISRYQKLSEPFIEKHSSHVDWEKICRYQPLSIEFIEKHIDKITWVEISRFQKLNLEFIDKYHKKLHMHYVSKYQILSVELIRKFQDELEWDYIVQYQDFDENFVLEFQNKIDFCLLIKHKIDILTNDFYELHWKKMLCILTATICNRMQVSFYEPLTEN